VHASTTDIRKAFCSAYEAFVDVFRSAAACLRCGKFADFPIGCFPPGGPFVVAPAAPA
jgi:hypothetical protein